MRNQLTHTLILLSLGALLGGCNAAAPSDATEKGLSQGMTQGVEVSEPSVGVIPTRLDPNTGPVAVQALSSTQQTKSPHTSPSPTATFQAPPNSSPTLSRESSLPPALSITISPNAVNATWSPSPLAQTHGNLPVGDYYFSGQPVLYEPSTPTSSVCSENFAEEGECHQDQEGDMTPERTSSGSHGLFRKGSSRSFRRPSSACDQRGHGLHRTSSLRLIPLCENMHALSSEDEEHIGRLFSVDKSVSDCAKEALKQSLLRTRGAYINSALASFVNKCTDATPAYAYAYAHMLSVVETLLKAGRRRSNWFLLLGHTISHQDICNVCIPTYKALTALLKDPRYGEKQRIWTLLCNEVWRLHAKIEQHKQDSSAAIAHAREALDLAQTSASPSEEQEQRKQELCCLEARAEVEDGLIVNVHRRAYIIKIFEMLHRLGFTDRPSEFSAVVGPYTFSHQKPEWMTEAERGHHTGSLPKRLFRPASARL